MNSTILNQMSQMKCYGMQRAYQAILDGNQHHEMTPDELVGLLIQAEWEEREHRKVSRYLKTARFRYPASIEEVNFATDRGLDKTQLLRLADGSYLKRKESILITGATGAGKSYLASALGHQACQQGYRTLYFNMQKLFPRLSMLRADGSYFKEITKIERHELLILDDFGLQPLNNFARTTLLEIIEDRHGRKSTIMASQLPVSKWYEVIGESTIADAILDRLTHTSHRIELKGESLRKKQMKNS